MIGKVHDSVTPARRQSDLFVSYLPVVLSAVNEPDNKLSWQAGAWSRGVCDVTAAGCQDPVLPAGVTFRRDGNRGVMTCDDSPMTLQYMKCEDDRWLGDVPNCSHGASRSNSPGMSSVFPLP